MMIERPILFSGAMVRALLAGTKTQTRRALKVQPLDILPMKGDKAGREWIGLMQNPPEAKGVMFRCKFGVPGDRLWVRERWRKDGVLWHYAADGLMVPDQRDYDVRATFARRAPLSESAYKWKPSIHMPRCAARLFLEIACIRVERLQDISEADAKAEGCCVPLIIYPDEPRESYSYATAYRSLWESINGPGSWAANPWVWCLTFKRVAP